MGNVVAFLALEGRTAAERICQDLVDLVVSLNRLCNQGAPMRKRPSVRFSD